ncbi:MAG: hypothetical protein AB7S26_12870 [Sandaracinaceae bacterium]
MQHKEHYMGPVIIGGVVAGVLSLIPIVNYCNLIFCMWMLLGSALAVYLVQNKVGTKIEAGEGAAIGGLTGLVTGGLFGLIYMLLFLVFGASMIPGAASGRVGMSETGMGIGMMLLICVGCVILALVLYGAFGALGGLIGSAVFQPSVPPSAGPPGGYGGPPPGGPPPGGFGQPPGGPPAGGFGQPPGGPPAGGFGQPPGGGYGQPPGGGGYGPPPGGGGTPPPGGGGFGQP